LHGPDDFTESGYNEFTLTYIKPDSTDELRVNYEVDGCYGGSPSNCVTEDDLYFTNLKDTPDIYSAAGGSLVRVKENETGLEFTTTSGLDFLSLVDTPTDYTGSEDYYVKVNSFGTGLEFTTISGLEEEKHGIEPVSNGLDSVSVTFSGTAFPSSNYTVTFGLENVDDSPPSVYATLVTAKSTTGFTVLFSGDMDSSNYKLNWIAKL
jgi:hypothetical protein